MFRANLAGWRSVLALVCAAVSLPAVAQPVDNALQTALTRAMGNQRGAAVVIDVHSGRVVASSHLDVAARRVAAPGSSIKPFTLLALLELGKVNAQTALVCKRSVSVGGHNLNCSHPATDGPLDPAQALAYSCNSFFTTVALRLTPAEVQRSFVHDGLATPTALTSNEAAGRVLLAKSTQQLQLQAVGEWGVMVTPLELAMAYRLLAQRQFGHDMELLPLFAGLEQSVTYGMGHQAQPPLSMKVAGKTGTGPSGEGAWTHAWFAGYAPAQDPEIVLVVFLEKGHGGGEAAAVAREVFEAFGRSHGGATTARGERQ